MSGRDELRDLQGPPEDGQPDRMDAAQKLTALLALDDVGLRVVGARVVGRGSNASADLYLSDDTEINFERFRTVGDPKSLAFEISSCTGASPKLNADRALAAVRLLRALAQHEQAFTADQIAADWGADYLQQADRLHVDLGDQQERWAAFERLDVDVHQEARVRNCSIARASLVLVDATGELYVRCGWFIDHVRSVTSGQSPQQISHVMLRTGWWRRGETGRIKATAPGRPGVRAWNFYVVPDGWLEGLA